jgi:hypothetical protein
MPNARASMPRARSSFASKFEQRLRAKALRYFGAGAPISLQRLERTRGKQIGFIRFVECWQERNREIGIVVLERFIDLPALYLNQYVFASLDLASAKLTVTSEVEGQTTVITVRPFPYEA